MHADPQTRSTLLIAASFGAATAAYAQDTAPDAAIDVVEEPEIVVTAQRREESLMRVPVAISVLGGAALDKSTSSGVADALRAVPGVSTLQSYQGGGTQVSIRGVTAGQALFNGGGTVGYYLDSVPFAAIKSAIAPDASAYDLERVEVLRGPQGTLYGASALNGVVRILTAPANPSHFGFKARMSAATTEGGAASYRGDVSANIPVIEDKLAVRATVGYAHEGGWIDTAFQDDFNSGDQWNLRLRATATPNDRLTIDLGGWISRSDFNGPSTGESHNFNSTIFRSPIHNRFDSANAKIAYAFDGFTVTSATSYLDYRSKSVIDFSSFADGFPVKLSTDLGVQVVTQEMSASSSDDGPLRWSVGGIYRHAKENLAQALPEIAFDLSNDNVSKSWAGFGELTYVAGPFELTGGLRYFRDRITQESQIPIGSPSVVVPSAVATATTPRIVATWHPTDRSSIYLSYSQGFRSGFPQTAPVLPPARPDRLHNYELGAKGALFGGLVSFDGAIYYIDWEDVQQNITVTVAGLPFAATINGEGASGFGVDAAFAIRPMQGLNLNGSVSWNDLTADGDIVSGGALLFPKGGRLNYSPKYTATGGFDYAFSLSSDLTARAAASATYTSRQNSALLLNGVATFGESDSPIIAKASFAVESGQGWIATLYADNITNYKKILNPGFGGLPQYYGRARPRTFGVQLEFKY